MPWYGVVIATLLCLLLVALATMLVSMIIPRCIHDTGMPMTTRTKDGKRDTFVVCRKCGSKFDYDWNAMKRGAERDTNSYTLTGR